MSAVAPVLQDIPENRADGLNARGNNDPSYSINNRKQLRQSLSGSFTGVGRSFLTNTGDTNAVPVSNNGGTLDMFATNMNPLGKRLTKDSWVCMPTSHFRVVWTALIFLVTVCIAIYIPFFWSFTDVSQDKDERWMRSLQLGISIFVDVFFTLDMYLRAFHFAFIGKSRVVSKRRFIRRLYLKGAGFPVDFVSTLPLFTVGLVAGVPALQTLGRVCRMLRVSRVTSYWGEVTSL